jgi:hypothetical protein
MEGGTHHYLPHHLPLIFLLPINSRKICINNNYFKYTHNSLDIQGVHIIIYPITLLLFFIIYNYFKITHLQGYQLVAIICFNTNETEVYAHV